MAVKKKVCRVNGPFAKKMGRAAFEAWRAEMTEHTGRDPYGPDAGGWDAVPNGVKLAWCASAAAVLKLAGLD